MEGRQFTFLWLNKNFLLPRVIAAGRRRQMLWRFVDGVISDGCWPAKAEQNSGWAGQATYILHIIGAGKHLSTNDWLGWWLTGRIAVGNNNVQSSINGERPAFVQGERRWVGDAAAGWRMAFF